MENEIDSDKAKEIGAERNNFTIHNKKVKAAKENKLKQKEKNAKLIELGFPEMVVEPEKKEVKALTPEQQRIVDIKRKHWLQFVWAIPFRIFEKVTGELPPCPQPGSFYVNGWPKNGKTPWDYVMDHMNLSQPFSKKEHELAYAIIAEVFTMADVKGPGKKVDHPLKKLDPEGKVGDALWLAMMADPDPIIRKWTKKDEFLDLSFGDALKYCRMEKRLTQGQLADLLNYGFIAISRWERMEYEPSPQAVYEIARRLPRMLVWFKYNQEWTKEHKAIII